MDDHSRLAHAEVLPSERAEHAVAFLRRAARWYAEQGLAVEQVMTDNGAAYASSRWLAACRELGLRAPGHPRLYAARQRQGRTADRHHAARLGPRLRLPLPRAVHRLRALDGWLRWYNRRRPHASLGRRPVAHHQPQEPRPPTPRTCRHTEPVGSTAGQILNRYAEGMQQRDSAEVLLTLIARKRKAIRRTVAASTIASAIATIVLRVVSATSINETIKQCSIAP